MTARAGRGLTLTGAAFVLAAALVFLALAGEVLEGETLAFDRAILLALRTPGDLAVPIGPAWLAEVARDVTGLGGTAILTAVTLAVVGYLALTHAFAAAWRVGLAVAGGTVLSTVLKLAYDRPRPDIVPHAVAVYSASFPSGHAMLSAVTYLTLGAMLCETEALPRVRAYLLGLSILTTLLVGISRIYLGVHWPTDVLAGWCGGAGWALLCWLVWHRWSRTDRRG